MVEFWVLTAQVNFGVQLELRISSLTQSGGVCLCAERETEDGPLIQLGEEKYRESFLEVIFELLGEHVGSARQRGAEGLSWRTDPRAGNCKAVWGCGGSPGLEGLRKMRQGPPLPCLGVRTSSRGQRGWGGVIAEKSVFSGE